jgi:hypothetical protein
MIPCHGKTRVKLTVMSSDGVLLHDKEVPTRTLLQAIPTIRAYQEVMIRLVVDVRDAEQVFNAIETGQVTLEVTGARPRI